MHQFLPYAPALFEFLSWIPSVMNGAMEMRWWINTFFSKFLWLWCLIATKATLIKMVTTGVLTVWSVTSESNEIFSVFVVALLDLSDTLITMFYFQRINQLVFSLGIHNVPPYIILYSNNKIVATYLLTTHFYYEIESHC